MSVPLTPPPRFDAPGIIIRAWTAGDAPLLRRALEENDAHLRAWVPFVVTGRIPGMTLEERVAKHAGDFADGKEWHYGIFEAGERAVIGSCSLLPRIGPGAIEIGYWLAARATGRGIATAAARLLTDAAFRSPDVERVEMRVEPGNLKSAAVPQRLGFVDAGRVEIEGVSLVAWTMTRERWAAPTG